MHVASRLVDRYCSSIPLRPDRYDRLFFLRLAAVFVFTLLAYWTLTDYADVQWYAGEDGVSEWWSVVAYLASASMAILTARHLGHLGRPRLALAYGLLSAVLVVGALEEVSWGQRLFGWSTPEALSEVNVQDETTFHNVVGFSRVAPTILFWGSFLALAGAVARALLHRRGRVSTADFLLPSLTLSPALMMIMFWIGAGQSFPGNLANMLLTHFDLETVGSEIPEVLMAICITLFTLANLRRAARWRHHAATARPG